MLRYIARRDPLCELTRTFTGKLLDAGVDLATAQALAGHVPPATTARYDRRPERTRRAAVDKLPTRSRRRCRARPEGGTPIGLPHAADATRAKQAEVVADLEAYISGRKPYTVLSSSDTAAKSFSGSTLARLYITAGQRRIRWNFFIATGVP